MTLKVHAPQNIARLFRKTPEEVKKAILKLYYAKPPFSYEQLYEGVWQSMRLKEPLSVYQDVVQAWQPSLRRDSYLRALKPTSKFFENFERGYEVEVLPRPYSIGRGLQAPFSPRMLCGTKSGPVVPWLLFWKENPLNEEQTALFHGMVLDAFRGDPDLDRATLMLVDTNRKALDSLGNPRVLLGAEIPVVSQEKMRSMLDVFASGYLMAQDELRKKVRTQRAETRRTDDVRKSRDDQPGLF